MRRTVSFPLLIVFILLTDVYLHAQVELHDLIRSGISIANELTEENVEMLRSEFDILTSSDNTRSTYRYLYAGQTYRIGALGDSRIKDIDIYIYEPVDNSWIEVKRDNTSARDAKVEITPTVTKLYRIDIKAYAFESGYYFGYYGLFVASTTGATSEQISGIMTSTLADAVMLESKYGCQIVRAEFDNLNKNSLTTKSTWRNLLEGVTYYAVAYGGAGIRDIDLYLYKQNYSGEWDFIMKDDDPISTALITVTPSTNGFYRFDVKAYSFETGYDSDVYGLVLLNK
jgi:YHS domain-containing protein